MTDFNFINYQDWISRNCHYYQCGVGPNNDTNINHASLIGERLNHPRIFRTLNTTSKLLNDVERGGIESPYRDNSPGDYRIYIRNTEKFAVGDEILIQDNNGSEDPHEIYAIQENLYLQIEISPGLTNSYDTDELYTVSTIREFTLDKPDEGSFVTGDYLRLGNDDNYLIREAINVDDSNPSKTTIKCARINRSFTTDDLVSVLFPVNGIAPDIDDAVVIPETTFPFNPQQFGIKAGSLHVLTLKDEENNETTYNGLTVETQASPEYGSINILFSTGDSDFEKFAQNLNFDNPMIMPGVNTETFDYSSDADMQLIWKGSTTTQHSNKLKWTYSSDSIYALFPLPLDFVARSGGDNEVTLEITGTIGNTGSLDIILYSADREAFSYDYPSELTSSGTITIDIDSFTGKQFVKKIEFRITGGSGILYFDDITPFKVPSFDDLLANPAGFTSTEVGSMAIYYDVREAPIHPLTANASASELTSIQLAIADTSDFATGDKIVLYDLDSFEFAEVHSVDDGTHITVTPLYGVFFYDYTTAFFASVQLLTYKTRKIAGAYSTGSSLQEWTKTAVLIEGDAGEWDRDSVSEPSVLFKNKDLYLSYTGRNGASYGIGFAYSINFTSFEKLPDNPYLSSFDNSKIIELNEFSGITCRDSNNDIQLYEQQTGFFKDFHVKLLVRPDSSLGYPDEPMVLYDQGNFRIEVNKNYTLTLYAYINGEWISTPADDVSSIGGGLGKWNITDFGTQLHMDHWNLIVAQFSSDKIGIYKVGLITEIMFTEMFTNSPWRFYEDMAGGATSFAITLADSDVDIPEADQSVYIWSVGTETDNEYDARTHWQLNRITSVTERVGSPGVYDCDLLNPIGPWGFAKSTVFGSEMGPFLAQGYYQTAGYSAGLPSSDGEFSSAHVNERGLEESVSEGHGLDPTLFSTPKIGSSQDRTKCFTKGLIAHCDVSNAITETDATNQWTNYLGRLNIFIYMIESIVGGVGSTKTPRWYQYDISAIGTVPVQQSQVAFWEFADYDSGDDMIPDSAHNWDLFIKDASGDDMMVASAGYGYAAKLETGDYMLVYKYSNLVNFLTLLESITGPSVNLIPQLFEDGIAMISTIEGKKDYYTTATEYPTEGHIILDIFESTDLPSSLDIDGQIYNPSNCSVKLYLSVNKIAEWNLIETYDSIGFVTIDETIDLSPYEGGELIYYLRLKLELISDGSDTTEVIEIIASASGIVEFPSSEFLDKWADTNNFPCLKIELIDDTDTHYDLMTDSFLMEIPNLTYEIPIRLDDESDILPSEIALKFQNHNGFWNWNNPSSPLNGKNYLDFKIIILAGFDNEYIPQGIYKIERIIQSLDGGAEVTCSSELREVLDQNVDTGEPIDPGDFIGTMSVRKLMDTLIIKYGGIPATNIYFDDSLNDYLVSNVDIDDESIISVLRRLAVAANYVIFINNQGEIRIINRGDMSTSGTEYPMEAGQIVKTASLTSAMRKNLIKKAKVSGANNVSVVVENIEITYGRHYSVSNNYIQSSDDATTIANQLISDYSLSKQILSGELKYSPHLKLLDILTFNYPANDTEDNYMIVSIDRNLTEFNEKITAILLED